MESRGPAFSIFNGYEPRLPAYSDLDHKASTTTPVRLSTPASCRVISHYGLDLVCNHKVYLRSSLTRLNVSPSIPQIVNSMMSSEYCGSRNAIIPLYIGRCFYNIADKNDTSFVIDTIIPIPNQSGMMLHNNQGSVILMKLNNQSPIIFRRLAT